VSAQKGDAILKAISIRNVPDNVYSTLQELARENHRSLQEQIKWILEQQVRLVEGSPVATAANWRKRFKGRKLSDTVEMVRQDRER
jgi:plasmid stability protein